MRKIARLIALCPAWTRPSGGVRKLYRHVDVLNEHGIVAFIGHREPGFRCRWFENRTPVAWPPDIWPPRDGDLLIVPEVMAWEIVSSTPGVPKVIFNQNPYQTFLGRTEAWNVAPYRHPDVLATIVVSEDSRRYLQYAFPGLRLFRIHNSVDPNLFHLGESKRNVIAYMPRKDETDLKQVLHVLEYQGRLGDFTLLPIENRIEAQTAEILRQAAIFLSFSSQEGSPMPPLEAMACGCVTIGYDGLGGREYLNDQYAFPVEQADIIGFASTVERVIEELSRNPQPLQEKARLASRFVLGEYSPEREARDIMDAWSRILNLPGRPEDRNEDHS